MTSTQRAADGKAVFYDATEQQQLVLLPEPPRQRRDPREDAAISVAVGVDPAARENAPAAVRS